MDKIIDTFDYKTEYETLKAENERLRIEVTNLTIINKWYLSQFRIAQQRRFCASSEKSGGFVQLGLFNEAEANAVSDEPEPIAEQTVSYKRRKSAGKRKEFYEKLPTQQVVHELPEDERVCPECGGELHTCGHEVIRREVEVIPAQVHAIEHVQTVYACRNCEHNSDSDALPMVKADVPAPVISGSGVASASLLALILCNKYVLALPLYRQERELALMGINISRQTMANWMIFVSERWLMPIYGLLCVEFLHSDASHADETTLQVIKEEGRSAAQKSYMWVYLTGKYAANSVVLFDYEQTRSKANPLDFLKDYKGFLHTDAYAGYHGLEEQGIVLVGCWTHLRRKFVEALKALSKADKPTSPANIGLEYCDRLFALERKFDELNLNPVERAEQRNKESKPIAEAFFAWAANVVTEPKSKLATAVGYAINQKARLMNVFLDGRLELSNNRAERAIRPFAVGRKNWLFSYSAKGARASAIIYSIIETAQANGLMPFLYLKYLFETLPNISADEFSDCLPWNPAVQDICKIPSRQS